MTTVQRWIQAVVLGATGAYFTYNLASGNVANYIANKFLWLSWLAAGLLLVLALMALIALVRPAPHDHDHDHDSAGLWSWAGLGLVTLPVVFGLLLPSRPLDSRAIEGVASDLSSINTSGSTRLDIAPQNRNILDWLRAFGSATDPAVLNGQPVDVVGFVYRDARFDGTSQFMVTRFIISCCVADAQAIGLGVDWAQAPTLREDTWIRVRGTLEVREFEGVLSPWLVADEGPDGIQVVAQPENPYLYP